MRTLRVVAVVAVVAAACAPGPAATSGRSTSTTTTTTSTTTTTLASSTTSRRSTTTSVATTTTTVEVGRLLVVGDYGNGGDAEAAVAAAMRAYAADHRVDAVVTAGDNLYTGRVGSAWDEPYGWLADAGIPVWVTWGNHDHQRPDTVRSVFGDPPSWTTHRWGEATVLILDSEQVRSDDQLAWMEQALADAPGPVIVVEHRPPWSCSSHGDNRRVQQRWVPVWEEAAVALVLSGHEHNYQHFAVDGIHYVVTGGGGAGLYKLKDCPADHPPRLGGAAAHEFVVLTQTGDGVTVEVVSTDGTILDSFPVAWR